MAEDRACSTARTRRVLAVCLNDIPELFNNLARPPRWLRALHERSALVRLLVNAEGREIDSVERLFTEPDAPRVREALDALLRGGAGAAARGRGGRGEASRSSYSRSASRWSPARRRRVVQERIAEFCRDERARVPRSAADDRGASGPGAFLDYDHLSPSGSAARRRHAPRVRPARGGRLRAARAAPRRSRARAIAGARAAQQLARRSARRARRRAALTAAIAAVLESRRAVASGAPRRGRSAWRARRRRHSLRALARLRAA